MSCLGLQGVELQLCRAAEAAEQAAAAANALRERDGWVEVVRGLADTLATLLLPLILLVALWRLWPVLRTIFETRKFTVKLAGFELSAQEATDQLRRQVEDLQAQVARLTSANAASPAEGDFWITAASRSGTLVAPAPSRPIGPETADADDPSAPAAPEPPASAPTPPTPEPPAAERASPAPTIPLPPPRRPTNPSPGGRLPARRVLWVDDRPANNAMLIAAFQEAGIEVETALSTAEALARLSSAGDGIALVISDQSRTEDGRRRPEAGTELVRRIAEDGHAVPVAIYTSWRGLRRAASAGAAGAALVTDSATDLRRFVETHMAGRRAD